MTEKIKRFLRRCQLPLLIALAMQSLNLCFFASLDQRLIHAAVIYPLTYLLCVLVSFYIPGKFRMIWGAGVAVVSVVCWILFLDAPRAAGIVSAVVFAAAMIWSLRFSVWSADQEGADFWLAAGLVVQVIILIAGIEAEKLFPVIPRARAILFAYVFLLMLSRNRTSMVNASDTRQQVTESMRRKNLLLVIGLFLGAVVVALAPSAYRFVLRLWQWLMALVNQLLSEAVPGTEKISPADLIGGQITGEVPPEEESFWLAQLLTMVTKVAVISGVIASAWMLLRKLWQILPRLLKRLAQYTAAVSEDYVDEITLTREFDIREKIKTIHKQNLLRLRDERKMSPEEQVRYRFQRLMTRHPEWSPGATAREKLKPFEAELYEKVRYSEMQVSQEDADHFRNAVKNI